jgi:hypothetical protein
MTEIEIREFFQDYRIHFKNRMAMEEVAAALIRRLATKTGTPPNPPEPVAYIIPRDSVTPTPPIKVVWSKQDQKVLEDHGNTLL